MVEPDLIARAVTRGLVLLPCACCDGARSVYMEVTADRGWMDSASLDGRGDCPACDGTGQNRTPAGVLMAVLLAATDARAVALWPILDETGRRRTRAGVTHPGAWRPAKIKVFAAEETPEGIAAAALTAWLRAQGGEE